MFMRNSKRLYIKLVAVFSLLLTRFVDSAEEDDQQALKIVGSRVVQTQTEHWGPELDSEVPKVELKDTDGTKRSVDDLRGNKKGLLLFFCIQLTNHRDVLLSDVQERLEQFADDGFAVVAVTDEEVEENKEHKKALKLEYPLLSDHDLEGAQKFDVLVLNNQNEEKIVPGVVVINSDNKVIFAQEFETLIIHSDHADGSYSNHYIHRPSVEEILKSLPRLSTESKIDTESAIKE